MNTMCSNPYITPEGKEVGCMGWLHLKYQLYGKEELYKCDLCGYTVIVKKKEVTPI